MEIKPQLVVARSESAYGEYVIEPLARGYGVTLGNPLRRILLNSIPGTAVTSVYIEDVLHEFSTIKGITEDVVQIILNLKDLVVKFHGSGPKTISLRKETPGEVKAGDFETGPDAEIINPELHVATVNAGGKLVMEVRIEEGTGYVPSERHATKDRINSIPVDAVYTPVRRVAYHVEDTRVGQQTDLDRLIVRVWTDGSVSPHSALRQAVSRLRSEVDVFDQLRDVPDAPISEGVAKITIEATANKVGGRLALAPSPSVTNPAITAPVETLNSQLVTLEGLGLTTRVLHSLKEEGIDTVEALCALSERDLKKVPGVGERSLDEIKKQLSSFGHQLKE